ncbi:MAG: hypothetical protein EHM23_27845 [Acidobacteria bacterium]|nr:MAG: hypothetical protein EHM23_27845 [Acidobacteriota bacterium]
MSRAGEYSSALLAVVVFALVGRYEFAGQIRPLETLFENLYGRRQGTPIVDTDNSLNLHLVK